MALDKKSALEAQELSCLVKELLQTSTLLDHEIQQHQLMLVLVVGALVCLLL